ncbi:MAG: phosphoribosylglycinamide formyltransferase [Actinomycetota bacterium]|nr:phosphoribosylglycinamide formyltransferase [Actinomycetota bacterium]MDQ3720924.1 phosphoribosylglycinamide formyltransferase [Actinomycetota bacterium]
MALRLAVLVSGEGTNLQAILDSVHGREGIEVVGTAASRAGAPGLERARQAGVETAVFAAADHADRDSRDRALGDWLEEHDAELVVLAGWMEILGPEFIRRFEGRVLNVHPSLLPSFPGVRAIEQAIQHGVRVTGVTVHFVDEGVDSGPIVLQEALELAYDREVDEVEREVHAIEHRLLPRAIALIAAGAVSADSENLRRVRIDSWPDADGARGEDS